MTVVAKRGAAIFFVATLMAAGAYAAATPAVEDDESPVLVDYIAEYSIIYA